MLRSTKTNTQTRTLGNAVTALDVREQELREDAFRLGQVNAHLPEEKQVEVLENLSEHLQTLDRMTPLEIESEVRRQFWKGTGAGMANSQ